MKKSRENKIVSKKSVLSHSVQTNLMRLRLLTHVDEFKRDVSKLRKVFSIPENGFNPPDPQIMPLSYLETPNRMNNSQSSKNFREQVTGLGKKFHLPQNYYQSSFQGVPWYILTNEISLSPSYEYGIDIRRDEGQTFIDVKFFGYISKKEILTLHGEILALQRKYLPPETINAVKIRKNFERDLDILEQYRGRVGKPKKIKQVDPDSYLARLLNDPDTKPAEIKAEKKRHPKSVKYVYPQSGQKMPKGNNSRNTIKSRLNKEAKEWFGYALDK